MPDEQVIEVIQSGDNMALDYLMNKYNDLVNMKASKFFMVGSEREDIIQEGMIGLYKATKSFDTQKQNSFKSGLFRRFVDTFLIPDSVHQFISSGSFYSLFPLLFSLFDILNSVCLFLFLVIWRGFVKKLAHIDLTTLQQENTC